MPRLKTVALATTAAAAIAIAPAGAMAAKAKKPPLQGATTGVSLFIEPDSQQAPVVSFINSAKKTLDFGIYQLNDPVIMGALVQARQRGVKVRVMATWQTFPAQSSTDPANALFNENTPYLQQLAAQGVKTGWSPYTFTYYHEKAMIADGHTKKGRALIMDFNSQPSYYGVPDPKYPTEAGARGFGVITTNPQDVAEIQATFDADFPPAQQVKSLSSPRLIWSPNAPGYVPRAGGLGKIMQQIDTAKKTLDVYALLLDYAPIQLKLMQAAKRGVAVRVLFNTSGPVAFTLGSLQQMVSAGIQFAHDPKNAVGKTLYVHTKTIIRDAGRTGALAYVGSMNVGDQVSVNAERELGILLANTGIVNTISTTFASDWAAATPVQVINGQVVNPFPPPKSK